MTDRYSCQQKGPGAILSCQPVVRRPRRTLRTASPCSPPLRDRHTIYKKFPDKNLGEKLFSLINNCDGEFESEITTINDWVDELKVSKWFSWIPFDTITGNS
jgi:hypothetical protein